MPGHHHVIRSRRFLFHQFKVRLAFLGILPVLKAVEKILHQIAVVGGTVHHPGTAVRTVDKPRRDAASASAGLV